MSEYRIPFQIQEEIMKLLPVKSLLQFRSVSKAYKSLIDSSEFITAHTHLRHTQPHHLLVSSQREGKYVSYIDDDTFPKQRSLVTLPPPLSTNQIINPRVIGSSHGLVGLYGMDPTFQTYMALLWNPSIRKSVVVDIPGQPDGIGFGVCPVTNDPKIVSITQSSWYEPNVKTKVMVYRLSSGKWRRLSKNLPTERIQSLFVVVTDDGFIYWPVESQAREMIMSFDVTNEIFEAIDLPRSLENDGTDDLYITKYKESLSVVQEKENKCTVWMMEHGVKRSFTKIFTIKSPHDSIGGFRKNGIPIMQVTDGDPYDPYGSDDDDDGEDYKPVKLVVYEPTSHHNNVLEITPFLFKVNPYMETLLLLGRSDCISY